MTKKQYNAYAKFAELITGKTSTKRIKDVEKHKPVEEDKNE